MIGELIFAAISGALVSYILMKFLISRQKKRREDPKRILKNLDKAKIKDFYIEGKKLDLVEEIKKGMIKQPNLPPTPEDPLSKDLQTSPKDKLADLQEKEKLLKEDLRKLKEKKKAKEANIIKNSDRQPGKTTINKMLGKK